MLYRICTENKPEVEAIVIDLIERHGFRGATLYKGIGIWKGSREQNLTIEIEESERQVDGDIPTVEAIANLAEGIRQALRQDAVMVVKIETESFLVR
jgi:PII-like signaling protein